MGAHRKKKELVTCLRSPICTQRATPARPATSKHSSACRSEEEHSLRLLLIAPVQVWVKSLHPPVSSYKIFLRTDHGVWRTAEDEGMHRTVQVNLDC